MPTAERPIRVLRLIARMNIGGPAIQISGLMQDLPKDTFEQRLVTGVCSENELDYLDETKSNIPVTRIHGLGRRIGFKSDLQSFLSIRKEIKEFDPDIVHTHTAKAGVLGRLACLTLSSRSLVVHTFHGHLLHGYFGNFKTRLVITIEKLLAIKTNVLVAVGEKVRNELIDAGIGSLAKFRVIGPGLELEVIPSKNDALTRFHLSDHPFTVGWVGRMTSIKAPMRVIELARSTKAEKLDVRFVMVGSGELFEDLENIISSESLPIHLLGWQSRIEPVLAITDLMLLTSLNEGTPVSLIEAQMAGIPILSTEVGSVSEVIIDNTTGRCLPFSVVEFMKIIRLFSQNKVMRTSMGAEAKSHAIAKFSRNRLIRDHKELYLSLINQANSSPKAQA